MYMARTTVELCISVIWNPVIVSQEKFHRIKMTEEKSNPPYWVSENPLVILNEMKIMMNEYHYQMMMMEKLKMISVVMEYFLNIHHEQNDIEDRTDSSRYNDKFDKELFYILDVDLTNVIRDIHEQIDIFLRIYRDPFHQMNDIILFCIVVKSL